MAMDIRWKTGLGAAGLAALLACSASGEVIVPGIYTLSNHPDAVLDPPPYGLRLDELYDVTGLDDQFTFDFDHPMSAMILTYDDVLDTIVISGVTMGGRDVGGAWAVDAFLGLYTVSFTYDMGVGLVPGDDDLYVNTANNSNFGTILTPLGDVIAMEDERGGNAYSFRLGDENSNLGHRGFPGISGWGWLNSGGRPHNTGSDWLFTAEFLIPTPGTAILAGMGLGLIGLRRRRA